MRSGFPFFRSSIATFRHDDTIRHYAVDSLSMHFSQKSLLQNTIGNTHHKRDEGSVTEGDPHKPQPFQGLFP